MKVVTVLCQSYYRDKTDTLILVSEGRRSSTRLRRKSEGTVEAGIKGQRLRV